MSDGCRDGVDIAFDAHRQSMQFGAGGIHDPLIEGRLVIAANGSGKPPRQITCHLEVWRVLKQMTEKALGGVIKRVRLLTQELGANAPRRWSAPRRHRLRRGSLPPCGQPSIEGCPAAIKTVLPDFGP